MSFEKVNPMHPDKIADRIAGAMVDLAYKYQDNPKVAIEVLIGHGRCHIIAESSYNYTDEEVQKIVDRIADTKCELDLVVVPQDIHLAHNQDNTLRCGDNGIFKGVPTNKEESVLAHLARKIYELFPTDGKYVLADGKYIICQSYVDDLKINSLDGEYIINPLGYWTGGINVDSGATNRKLGSDMGRAVTGGGLHGKDLSKADVTLNIYAHLKAQETCREVNLYCAIGDEFIDGKPYAEIVEIAREYVNSLGGFEKLAEWGLIRLKHNYQ